MGVKNIIDNIRLRKTPFYGYLYKCYQGVNSLSPPYIKPVAGGLYYERIIRRWLWNYLMNKLYYEQLLRFACTEVGKNVRTDGDIPLIVGHGTIRIGDNVFIGNRQAWIVQKNLFPKPELIIGSNTSLNYRVVISVECKVEIGNNCRIAEEVKIFDNNSHNIHYQDRTMKIDDVKPIRIDDDVWIGMNSIILKGVTIGKGSVVAAGSIVTKNVPPLTLVGGNPARIIKEIK